MKAQINNYQGDKPRRVPGSAGPASANLLGRAEPINPRWAWHYRTLWRLRDRLREQRGRQLAEAQRPIEPHSQDMADSATDEFDHDLALSQVSAGQNTLFEVEEALSRIRRGTYGTCEATGRKIPAARLRAIPWARFDKDVEERLEARGLVASCHVPPAQSLHDTVAAGLADAEEEASRGPGPEAEDEALHSVYRVTGKRLHERHQTERVVRQRPSGKVSRTARIPRGR